MAEGIPPVSFLAIPLDASSSAPLYRQLYDALRGAILSGSLKAGERLPASRTLSDELCVSRNTVLNAYEQLLAEGYLEGKVGAGTFVTRTLPERALLVRGNAVPNGISPVGAGDLSRRGAVLANTPAWVVRATPTPKPFLPGVPAIDTLPFKIWANLSARHWRRSTSEHLGYGDPAGYRPLREAIAAHLGTARAVVCEADQVIIVAGTQQGLDLASRKAPRPGRPPAWIEDPGFVGARGALIGAGARLIPVPVDEEGIVVSIGVRRDPRARLAYVTPSHQYPLGVTMSLSRRLELLGWACQAGSAGPWRTTSTASSSYRYRAASGLLQGLDKQGRVALTWAPSARCCSPPCDCLTSSCREG